MLCSQSPAQFCPVACSMGLGVVKKRLHWGLLVLLVIYAFLFYGFSEVSEASDTLQV